MTVRSLSIADILCLRRKRNHVLTFMLQYDRPGGLAVTLEYHYRWSLSSIPPVVRSSVKKNIINSKPRG